MQSVPVCERELSCLMDFDGSLQFRFLEDPGRYCVWRSQLLLQLLLCGTQYSKYTQSVMALEDATDLIGKRKSR
jgi:hypothetical protein